MTAKAVQISIDQALLKRIDAQPEARRHGRSAFIRSAVTAYLRARERADVDAAIGRAYSGKADDLLAEIDDIVGAQAWPKK